MSGTQVEGHLSSSGGSTSQISSEKLNTHDASATTISVEIDPADEIESTTPAKSTTVDSRSSHAGFSSDGGLGLAPATTHRSQPLSPILDTSPAPSPGESEISLPVAQHPPPASVSSPPPLKPSDSAPAASHTKQPQPQQLPNSPSSPTLRSPVHKSFGFAPTSSTASASTSASASGQSSSANSRARTRPASVLVASLAHNNNTSDLHHELPKPRSNSSLQSSRPAPPSPANSRPPSQVLNFSPGFSPASSPRGSPAGPSHGPTSPPACASATFHTPSTRAAGASPGQIGRDRAPSTSSAGRRLRPKSTLGTSVFSGALFHESEDLSAVASEPSTPVRRSAEHGRDELSPAAEVQAEESASTSRDRTRPSSNIGTDNSEGAATLISIRRRVIVRDYAFPANDARFDGLGPQRPHSNWGEGEPEPEKPKQPEPTGWGGFSLSLGSWNLMRRGAETEPQTEGTVEDLGTDHSNDDYWSDDQDDDEDDYDDDDEPDGLFRAAYPFDPEGVNEMAIVVGDLLDVRGRGGGGDGWVVAIRLDTGEEGLVPEGYLERAAERNYPDEWDKVRSVREAMSLAAPGESSSQLLPERGNVLAQPVCATPAGVSPESP